MESRNRIKQQKNWIELCSRLSAVMRLQHVYVEVQICGGLLPASELWDPMMAIKGSGLRSVEVEIYHHPSKPPKLAEMKEKIEQAMLTPESLKKRLQMLQRKRKEEERAARLKMFGPTPVVITAEQVKQQSMSTCRTVHCQSNKRLEGWSRQSNVVTMVGVDARGNGIWKAGWDEQVSCMQL